MSSAANFHNDPARSTCDVRFILPRADDQLRDRMASVIEILQLDPQRYNLAPPRLQSLAGCFLEFDREYQNTLFRDRRTPLAIERKNSLRELARPAFLSIIDEIRRDPAISLHDKLALGFTPASAPRGRPKQPIPPPDSFPVLAIIAAGDGTHTLRYVDCGGPDAHSRRKRGGKRGGGKPQSAKWLELHIIIAPLGQPVNGPIIDACPPVGGGVFVRNERITRNPFTITFDRPAEPFAQKAHYATYFARWLTAASRPGPWNLGGPVSMTIAYAFNPATTPREA